MKKLSFTDSAGNFRKGYLVLGTKQKGLVYQPESEAYFAGFIIITDGYANGGSTIAIEDEEELSFIQSNISKLTYEGYKETIESVRKEFRVMYCEGSPTEKMVNEIVRLRNAQEEC